jgi:hypothetical protein
MKTGVGNQRATHFRLGKKDKSSLPVTDLEIRYESDKNFGDPYSSDKMVN